MAINISKRDKKSAIILVTLLLLTIGAIITINYKITGYSILDINKIGFWEKTYKENFNIISQDLQNSESMNQINNKLWVPWYSTSTSCKESNLQRGQNCNIGTVNGTNNCMVTDELSQAGIIISMNDNQTVMDQYYNTIKNINSTRGTLPSWKILRQEEKIVACDNRTNNNCDTASDADARIIISLITAANNQEFDNESKKEEYSQLAKNMSEDFIKYEIYANCKESSIGYGNICYWLASGSETKNSGLSANNYAFTGYYPDATIAMLEACASLKNQTYCDVAANITLNYLQASKTNGSEFRTPPGKSFKWTNITGTPVAECTDTCNPPMWDDADAPRALGMCMAQYYARMMNKSLPGMEEYCTHLEEHLQDPRAAAYQYYPNGTEATNKQNSYYAQGLQLLGLFNTKNLSLFEETLQESIKKYEPTKKMWEGQECFGIYHSTFTMRALGASIGLGEEVFLTITNNNITNETNSNLTNITENNPTNTNTSNTNVSNQTTNNTVNNIINQNTSGNTNSANSGNGGGGSGGSSATSTISGKTIIEQKETTTNEEKPAEGEQNSNQEVKTYKINPTGRVIDGEGERTNKKTVIITTITILLLAGITSRWIIKKKHSENKEEELTY